MVPSPAPRSIDPTSVDSLLRLTEGTASGCLLWTGATCGAGYPIFKKDNLNIRVARKIYLLVHGTPKAEHFVVEPKCGNLRCVAPEHLHMAARSKATRRLVGVPLPKGQSLKSANYRLVLRTSGPAIWEPYDIAVAVWTAKGIMCCVVCGVFMDQRGKAVCSARCANQRNAAKKRLAAGKGRPTDHAMCAPVRAALV